MRCVEWYGRDRVTLLNADTNKESEGNYALVSAVVANTGCEYVHLDNDGKDIWDVFMEHGVMKLPNGGCKASVELKQKPLNNYMAKRWAVDQVVIAAGMSWMEPERQSILDANLYPFTVFYPLNVQPKLSDCEIVAELERYGLPTSDQYRKGYSHDNCNGGCVLAGMSQWAGLLEDDPEQFAYDERREREFYERTGFSILKDRRGGEAKPYPLFKFREDLAAGRPVPNDWRSTCGCMLISEDNADFAGPRNEVRQEDSL
jgi:hypothetical protein